MQIRLSGGSHRRGGGCTTTYHTTFGIGRARLGSNAGKFACGIREGEPAHGCRLFLLTADLFGSPFVRVAEALWS